MVAEGYPMLAMMTRRSGRKWTLGEEQISTTQATQQSNQLVRFLVKLVVWSRRRTAHTVEMWDLLDMQSQFNFRGCS